MTQDSKVMTWIVVIVLAVVIIGGAWWYFSQQAASTNSQTTTTTTTGQIQSSQKAITSFGFPALVPKVVSTITDYTVLVTVPKGTNVKTLTPVIVVSDLATVSPSSDTMQDFTNPVTYTVTAQDGSTQNYTVTVKVSAI